MRIRHEVVLSVRQPAFYNITRSSALYILQYFNCGHERARLHARMHLQSALLSLYASDAQY